MADLVDKFIECVCAGQCSSNGIAAFTPEHVVSLENKEPEKLSESKITEFCEEFFNERRTSR